MSPDASSRHALESLPVIDIAPFLDGGSDTERAAVARELRRVCIDIGFFYLVGHGISNAELDETLSRGRDFFRLPLAQKQPLLFNKARYGYFPLGGANEYGKAGDLKERFSCTREAIPGEPEDGNFGAGQSCWPDDSVLPGFRDFFQAHIEKRAALTRALARVFALSLDLRQDYFDAAFAHLGCVLMFNHYPKIGGPTDTRDPARWSFSPHTDYGAFTLLSQDQLGGLQVRNAAGDWIDVTPLAGSFVINIGDMFAMWTNDLYKSSIHRVMNFNDAERLSLAFFTYPQGLTEIACLPSCMSPGNPPRYAPVQAEAYNRALVAHAASAGKPGLSTRTEERLRT
ncbi:MAG TPA: 2-oxoglutarate and iron-dependent oxygenase domain-containing protein [Stellaceae bacterium]|jgi:isopenicillin N synthase-like dioxygenase